MDGVLKGSAADKKGRPKSRQIERMFAIIDDVGERSLASVEDHDGGVALTLAKQILGNQKRSAERSDARYRVGDAWR
jgi:hypothetical protein